MNSALNIKGRIERRTAVVGAIKPSNPIMDEREVHHRIDLAKQMIFGDQLIECHHLERGLCGGWFLQHIPMNHKTPGIARGLSVA